MADAYLVYQRSKFATRLPTDRLFTQSHCWLLREEGDRQRIGFTKFATRMLGEVVEYDFEVETGTAIETGQTIGWLEGFKAVTDLYSPLTGRFAGANPDLANVIGDIHSSPYDRGWLYRVEGQPPDDCMTPAEYALLLDTTIDKMMGRSS